MRASGSYQEGTGKSQSFGMWNYPRGHVCEFRRETGLILRCNRKVGNPFQTKQGSRPSCRDQEGRRGSEEVVPENLGVPLQGDRISGNFVGRIKGAKCPFDLQFLTWDFS